MQKLLQINQYVYLVVILIIAAFFRLYNINWDQNYHFHPDERAIVLFTLPLHLPITLSEFLSVDSPLNPHFFAYGSLPLYLLKIFGNIAAGISPVFATYDGINLVGRVLSAFFDIATIITLFFIGKKLFNTKIGLLASFLYTVSVLPIQLSHFFAVDTLLTFLILQTLYQLMIFYEKPTFVKGLLVGISFGLALATKISAVVLTIPIIGSLAFDLRKFFNRFFIDGVTIIFIAIITFVIAEPYSVIDLKTFLLNNQQQSQMTHNAFTFPYTLQYVTKIHYWYELKNIFFWGLGPIIALLSFLGIFYFTWQRKKTQELILTTFFWIYFAIVGSFAIGFMRYLLPIYPLLCLFGAVLFLRIVTIFPATYRLLFVICYLLFALIWPLSFMHIYSVPQTKITASNWIHQNIPKQSTLAVEHWDDRLPISGSEDYHFVEMTLYDQPDDDQKWQILNQKLTQADYIILASNRLYVPLPKLADCTKYIKCYPKVTQYYEKLFSGSLGFQKVAEFTSYPTIPLLNIPIDDQGADENFTVFDHPKIIIFKKL